jgi:GNAT superfamily N-acetyltransferase
MVEQKIEILATQARHAERIAAIIRASIEKLCAADHGNDPFRLDSWLANKTTDNVRGWIEHPGNIFVHAVLDENIVGAACATKTGRIDLVYIDPVYRGRGISAALLNHLEQELASLGVRKAALESTRTARNFYHRHGWRETKNGNLSMIKYLGERPRQHRATAPLAVLQALRPPSLATRKVAGSAVLNRLRTVQARPTDWFHQFRKRI